MMKVNSKISRKNRIFKASAMAVMLMAGGLSQGCLGDIEPEREVRERGTFGTELYNIVYDNSVHSKDHSSEAFLSAFREDKDVFVDAVDTTAIPEDLEAINDVFVNIVPLYENLLYPGTLRKVAVVMDEVRQDPAVVDALTWLAVSPTLLKQPEYANPLGMVFGYDDIAGITDEMIGLLLKNTGRNATNQLLKELSISLDGAKGDTNPDRFVRRAVDMLLAPDDSYAPSVSYEPQLVAKLDVNGRAVVAKGMESKVGSTYDDMGWLVVGQDQTVSPFEIAGNPAGYALENGVVTYQGSPVFETFDLQKTPIAYLIREGDALLRDDTLDEALRAFRTLLGTPQDYEDENGKYKGYPADSATIQLLAALLATLDHDSVGPNFEAIVQLLEKHQDVVAKLFHDVDVILDIWDEMPSNLSADNNLIDRLLPELLNIAQEPGLLADLFMALDDPRAAKIAPFLAELAEHKKAFIEVDPNGAYNKCFLACDEKFEVGTFERMNECSSCPIEEVIGKELVDWNAPESIENRSLFQRTTHLMWETSQTPYDVHAEFFSFGDSDLTPFAKSIGTMLSFDNLAEAYLQTLTGHLHLVEHLSGTFMDLASVFGDNGITVVQFLTKLTDSMFNLKLSIDPTTAEVTRMFNMALISSQGENYRLDLNTADCRSGIKCRESNADVLYALEAVGLIDALYPLIKVFNDHGKTDIFARIVSILFEYYPTGSVQYLDVNGKPIELIPSDFRSLEPLLIRALKETDIVADVGAFGDALLDVELSDGSKLTERFEKFVAYLLTPDKELRNLKGQEFTKDPQGNFIAPLSPAYLYVDALRELSDFLDAHPDTKDQLSKALEGITKITVKTVKKADGTVSFEKPAGIQIIADVLKLLHTIYEEKTADGTRKKWINEDAIPEVKDLASGRLLYAYFQLFSDLDERPNGLLHFRRFVLHLMESGKEVPMQLPGTAYLLGDMLLQNTHLTALGRALASPLDPDRVWTTEGFSELSFVMTLLTCVDAFNECDPDHAFNRVFYRLFETDTRKRSNLMRLLDVGGDVFRVNPGSKARRNAADMKTLLDFAYDLFTDDDRGVERIYGVIDFTIWGNDRRPADWKPEDASWQIDFSGNE